MEKKHPIRRYLIAGLLVWVPLVVTLLVIKVLVDTVDRTLELIPQAYQPDTLLGFHLPGIGLVFSLIVVIVTGIFVTNILGARLVKFWEGILNRIPLVRSIYYAVKQVLTTIFSDSTDSFRKVLLVEYPRKGIWSIGFQTSTGFKQSENKDLITVFVPTTPNPTSGFLLMFDKNEVKELEMSVDEALKMVISLGVVLPKGAKAKITNKVEDNKHDA